MTDTPQLPGGEASHRHVYGALGENITLTCTMAALPYDDVTFNWVHTGENGTTYLGTYGGYINKAENVSSNVTLNDLDRYSYGYVTCTGTNSIGTGDTQKIDILQRGMRLVFSFIMLPNC